MKSHFQAIASCFGKSWKELTYDELREGYKTCIMVLCKSSFLLHGADLDKALNNYKKKFSFPFYLQIYNCLVTEAKKKEQRKKEGPQNAEKIGINRRYLDIEKAKTVSLLDIIDIPLKKYGKIYRGLCPFHSETKPSFTVYPNRNYFICFGCGERGDVIAYVQKRFGLSFKEAVKYLLSRL